jgi:hypothetical protein
MFTFHGRSMLLSSFFTRDVAPSLSTVWLGLVRNPALPTDTGDTIEEIGNAGYTRVGYGLSSAWWTLTAYGLLVNTQPVYWPGAVDAWGRVAAWVMATEPSGGLLIAGGEFAEPTTVEPQGLVALAPGMLQLELG